MSQAVEQALELIREDQPESTDRALALLQNTVYSFSMKVCGHPQDAEDTMQDVLLKSIPYLAKFDNPQALTVWLYKVARNRCISSHRGAQRSPAKNLSLDELMPDREASDAVFRLSLAVLQELRGPVLWMPLTYFELWMTRLMGFLPEFSECVVCGRALDGSRAFYHALADGLMCLDDKRVASSELSSESRKIAAQMLRSRVSEFAGIDWPKAVCADLRKFLLQILERHIEKKLVTAGMLEKI